MPALLSSNHLQGEPLDEVMVDLEAKCAEGALGGVLLILGMVMIRICGENTRPMGPNRAARVEGMDIGVKTGAEGLNLFLKYFIYHEGY